MDVLLNNNNVIICGKSTAYKPKVIKIYFCLEATEKGLNLDPAMFSGYGDVPRLHPCIGLLPRGLSI